MYNLPVDYKKTLIEQRDDYVRLLPTLTKQEFAFLAGKDSFHGKCFGFLTRAYYQRSRLLREGQLVYGYAFKAWTNTTDSSKTFPSWVIFSPEDIFSINPNLYAELADKIQLLCDSEVKDRDLKKFKALLTEELADPCYVRVPDRYSDGHLVYMSTIYVRPNQLPIFRLGLSIIIMNPNVSKEVLYLPQKYMNKQVSKLLFNL